ncbi:tyrosine-type recombinase/integrase [endosymbiont 'TC1' of Trimyema compressum]|uniref:tyrosine-type recombinase/integrase n=1 Tax=endosymbiont 'TC1' of Trimyema compressum TaxID=243899 RepID=UPI00139234C5
MHKLSAFSKTSNSVYIFSNDKGSFLDLEEVSRRFARTCKILNIKVTLKSLRHTHATLLSTSNEVPLKAIQLRLGHGSATFTTDTYIQKEDTLESKVANINFIKSI